MILDLKLFKILFLYILSLTTKFMILDYYFILIKFKNVFVCFCETSYYSKQLNEKRFKYLIF